MDASVKEEKSQVDKFMFFIPLGIVILLCLFVWVVPEQATAAFNFIFSIITGKLGWALQFFFLANTFLMLYFIFGKYSTKRLGNDPPEFSTPVWFGMLFAAGTSGVAVYWGFSEWFQYATWPPFGAEPLSAEALEWASTYSFFHWGPSCYGLYATIAVVFGYFFFVKREDSNRPSIACRSLIGEKHANGWLSKVIDCIYMMGIIGAVSAAIGLSTPLVSAIIVDIFKLEYTIWIDAIVLIVMAIWFTIGVYGGLHKTIEAISNFKIWIVMATLIFVFIIGPKSFILNNFTNSMGIMANNFFSMMLSTDPIAQIGFPQSWTVFFFAWWAAYALNTGIFLARISRGRTVRELIIGATFSSCIGCWLHFIIFGYYGMNAYMKGLVDVIAIYQTQGIPAAIIAIIKTMPLASIVLAVFLITMIVSTVTVINGAAYTLSIVSAKKLSAKSEPVRWSRVFWAVALGCLGLALIFMGGLTPIQTISISTGFLTMIIIILIFIAFFKYDGKNWDKYLNEQAIEKIKTEKD